MSNPHEGHQAAVHVAKNAIGEVQETLSAATDRAETAIGAIIMAVGQNPHVSSAQGAMNSIQEAKDRIQEVYVLTQQAIEHLDNYAAGF